MKYVDEMIQKKDHNDDNNNDNNHTTNNTPLSFVDLGSGAGKLCLTVALLRPNQFKSIIGIEYLPTLANYAQQSYTKLIEKLQNDTEFSEKLIQAVNNVHTSSPNSDPSNSSQQQPQSTVISSQLLSSLSSVQLLCNDLTVYDWSLHDVVFVCASAFDDYLLESVARAAQKCKIGTILISVTLGLHPAYNTTQMWQLVQEFQITANYGAPNIFIYKKVHDRRD